MEGIRKLCIGSAGLYFWKLTGSNKPPLVFYKKES